MPHEPIKLHREGATIKVYPVNQPIISLYCNAVPGSPLPALPFAQPGVPLLPEAASPEEFALLNMLVRNCDEGHDCMAVQDESETAAKLPTRVIDVGRNETEPIRLVETNHEPVITDRYIVLGHHWDRLNREQRTHTDTIAQRKERISYDELPATFQDALRVTRALGVRYLWIDALCIIQDDPSDWATEAVRMEGVFTHAYCLIVAESSLVGFLGVRRPRDVITLPAVEGPPLYLAEYIDDFRADVENSVLNSNGWVLQERALCRRTIYFTSKQIYWECGKGVICETLAQLRNSQSRFLGDSNFPSFSLQFYEDESVHLVQQLYADYSALKFTAAKDRCRAIAGLQRRIARAFESAATHGVLWRWPGRTLLWRAAQPGALARIYYDRDCDSAAPPPSWSWMAYDGRIEFMDTPFAGVDWRRNVRGPPDAEGDGRVAAEASDLLVDGADLMARAVLDEQGVEYVEGSWKGVVMAWREDDAARYVLLICPVETSSPSGDLYERVGVATLLRSHLSADTIPIFIV
ncbi:hypothetical protein diail_3534 [Diaporthe ilicicola]|nr:hypothetical protein diail_3534 [Diaporthe ilicicola]